MFDFCNVAWVKRIKPQAILERMHIVFHALVLDLHLGYLNTAGLNAHIWCFAEIIFVCSCSHYSLNAAIWHVNSVWTVYGPEAIRTHRRTSRQRQHAVFTQVNTDATRASMCLSILKSCNQSQIHYCLPCLFHPVFTFELVAFHLLWCRIGLLKQEWHGEKVETNSTIELITLVLIRSNMYFIIINLCRLSVIQDILFKKGWSTWMSIL